MRNWHTLIKGAAIVLTVAIVGWTIWDVWQKQFSNPLPSPPQAAPITSQSDPMTGWLAYVDNTGAFSIRYPRNWSVTTRKEAVENNVYVYTKLISPNQTILTVNTTDGGGRGGVCLPNAGDVPFQPGNECPSFEYTSAEKLGIEGLYVPRDKEDYQPDGAIKAQVYMVTARYGNAAANEQRYAIGLMAAGKEPPIKQPTMGAVVFDHPVIGRSDRQGSALPAIEIYAESASPEFFISGEGEVVKNILRTFSPHK